MFYKFMFMALHTKPNSHQTAGVVHYCGD